jgi:hypothetical protein
MGDGRWEMGDGTWEMGHGDGRWEMGDGTWEMGNLRRFPIAHLGFAISRDYSATARACAR